LTEKIIKGMLKLLAFMKNICRVEIVKDGINFVARAHLPDGTVKEYRNEDFEDALTEMVIDLQEMIED